MAAAALLKMARKDETALFVGQWAAPLLLMGVYNKMVKQHGSGVESRKDKPNMAGSGQDDFQYARGANS